MSACVESVSVPYLPLSISSTRAPARASNSAVAAPAQRAPTMTASTFTSHLSSGRGTGTDRLRGTAHREDGRPIHRHPSSDRSSQWNSASSDADVDWNAVGEHVEHG